MQFCEVYLFPRYKSISMPFESDCKTLRKKISGDIHPDIENNLDILLRRFGKNFDGNLKSDNPSRSGVLTRSKNIITEEGFENYLIRVESYLTNKYSHYLSGMSLTPIRFKESNQPNAHNDILVPLVPFRKDYLKLISPITKLLADGGANISLFVPPEYDPPSHEEFGDVNIIDACSYYTLTDAWKVRNALSDIGPDIEKLLSFDEIGPYDNEIISFYKSYYIDKYIFLNLLRNYSPSIIFGFHFITRPGYLSAIREYVPEIPSILIQHGTMSALYPPNFHDFKGADTVLMWGERGVENLQQRQCPSIPNTERVGNPKIEAIYDDLENSHENENGNDVLFISSVAATEEHSKLGLEYFCEETKDLNISTLYQPHPGEDMEYYDQMIEENYIESSEIIEEESVHSSIYSSKVVVGTQSTALIEAIALDTPVIQILPELATTDWDQNGMACAHSEDDLKNLVNNILENERFKTSMLQTEQALVNEYFDNYKHNRVDEFAAGVLLKHLTPITTIE